MISLTRCQESRCIWGPLDDVASLADALRLTQVRTNLSRRDNEFLSFDNISGVGSSTQARIIETADWMFSIQSVNGASSAYRAVEGLDYICS
jgi:hypothetical protein